jgi:tetrahydromethanopterin S-methyltransferase subunit G
LKQKNAIAEVVKSSSQKTNDDIILGLKTRLDDIEDKLAIAVNSIENSEQDKKIQTRVGLKLKALWGLVGGGLIIAADVIFKLADFWFQKKP